MQILKNGLQQKINENNKGSIYLEKIDCNRKFMRRVKEETNKDFMEIK